MLYFVQDFFFLILDEIYTYSTLFKFMMDGKFAKYCQLLIKPLWLAYIVAAPALV